MRTRGPGSRTSGTRPRMQDPGTEEPRTPGPGTQDRRLRTQDSRLQNLEPWDFELFY